MDLHAAQVQGSSKPVDHLLSLPIMCEYVKGLDIMDNICVVSPDAGFAKTARRYADYLHCSVAIGTRCAAATTRTRMCCLSLAT